MPADDGDIQIFLIPPTGNSTEPIRVNPFQKTLRDLRCLSRTHQGADEQRPNHYWDEEHIRLTVNGKPVDSESATLDELGVTDGSVIRALGRLRGGGRIKIVVETRFGKTRCR